MKKFVSLLLTGALACALLAGCGGGNTASPSPSAPASSAPVEPSAPAASNPLDEIFFPLRMLLLQNLTLGLDDFQLLSLVY